MMKLLLMTLMLVAATTVLAAPATIDDPTPVEGVWVFSMQTASGVVTAEANLTIKDGAVQGTLTSPSGDLTVFGNADDKYVRLYASAGSEVVMGFTGERSTNTISGTAEFLGIDQVGWTARRK